ncbi:hypothetical protein [Thioalkalivibrio sp. ALJ1]|uniref:hypothetical protein n=1 Tax=Thioalkalivibrio sp. ALJ1 TaxID=1158144 RepID=UPI00056E7A9F|nr:hypothetical protein [Thioalkalivibrio sp. ALJ1]
MADSSDTDPKHVVGDIVRFRSDLFFDGAVQLRWVSEAPERALKAASHFVFHGPRYHAVTREDASDGYVLRDTATFSTDLVEGLAHGETFQGNPFSLAIAGYGSGKSHLAVTLAKLLNDPSGELAVQIQENVQAADVDVGGRLATALDSLKKPVLTVLLDGMANFNLGAELSRSIIVKLRSAGCDLAAVEELSPRFKAAEQFVVRNFALRGADFAEELPGGDAESIIALLSEHDEATYSAVDTIFERANGTHIPVEGLESVQDLIVTVTSLYCGENGPFSGMLILFDEFGRFLEYAAEQPQLAGDSALQQLFQGVQDSAGRARFLGFIQYDLKAYASRIERRDLMHLQRYITRFDAADKSYLSTNLETLFAHLIEKRDADFVDRQVARGDVAGGDEVAVTHYHFIQALPEATRLPVWHELEQFRQVICAGCWPLDPLAVWFLTRQQDVVQSRSALNIVKASVERIAEQPALTGTGHARVISAADLLLTDMLPEFVAAEQARGGAVAETLQGILEERDAQLEANDRRILAAAAVLLKLRVRLPQRDKYERFLALAAGVHTGSLAPALHHLGEELGVLEWNDDFGQYELIQDAATRGQFRHLLRSRAADPATQVAGPLFRTYARTLCGLQAVDPGFAEAQSVATQDWLFEPVYAASDSITDSIVNAFKDWRQAADVNEAKGRIIYTYVGSSEDLERVRGVVRAGLNDELRKHGVMQAPVWVSLLCDADGRLAESLQRWWVLERGLTEQDKERYRRFVSAEAERVVNLAQSATTQALSERLHEVAGFDEAPSGRLSKVGQEVLAVVYPQVVPFPFDGFSTGTGVGTTAKKDCLEIVRALVSGEADAEWVQSRGTRLRNRASQLLARAWDVFDRDGSLAAKPGNRRISDVLDTLDGWHQEKLSRSLEESRRALIAAPYGCSLASAGIILGLFVARRWPQRRLFVDGEAIQAAGWIGEAFKANDLNGKVLARTTVHFIAEDAQARWEHLLEDWRNATRHRQRIEYRQQAKSLEGESAVPVEFVYQYEQLVDQASQAQATVQTFESKFEQLQRELEGSFQKANSLSALAVCDRLVALHQEVTNGAWEAEEVDYVERLLPWVRSQLEQEAPRWIERAHCRSPQEVGEYRHKMERAAATCRRLDLPALAERVDRQKTNSIATVEDRFKYQSVFAEARQFARMTTISPVAAIVELEAVRSQADRFSEELREARQLLQEPDLDEIVEQLQQHQSEATDAIARHRADLQELYQTSIYSLDTARALQRQIAQAREVFSGQPDLRDIEDARQQLEKICLDLETWSSIEGSPEGIEAQLSSAIEARCAELDQWCDDAEVDPLWSFRELYGEFCKRHVAAAHERSALWLRSSVPRLEEINTLSLEQCRQRLKVLEGGRPGYLGTADLEAVERICEALRSRASDLEQQHERIEAERWLAQFEGLDRKVDELSGRECDQLLQTLRAPPEQLNVVEKQFIQDLTTAVEQRLDALDVSDIIVRIRRLNPHALRQVIDAIKHADNAST